MLPRRLPGLRPSQGLHQVSPTLTYTLAHSSTQPITLPRLRGGRPYHRLDQGFVAHGYESCLWLCVCVSVTMKMSSRAFRDKYTGAGHDSAKFCQMLSMVRHLHTTLTTGKSEGGA
jgi:hypothetical protein